MVLYITPCSSPKKARLWDPGELLQAANTDQKHSWSQHVAQAASCCMQNGRTLRMEVSSHATTIINPHIRNAPSWHVCKSGDNDANSILPTAYSHKAHACRDGKDHSAACGYMNYICNLVRGPRLKEIKSAWRERLQAWSSLANWAFSHDSKGYRAGRSSGRLHMCIAFLSRRAR